MLALKFSRDDESEADALGLVLASRAGYDPRAGVSAPSIYPHFADQPAIMLAVVRRAWGELDPGSTALAAPTAPACASRSA